MSPAVADPLSLTVVEASQAGQARRAAIALAGSIGLGERHTAECAIIATELATNLSRHARGGELVMRSLSSTAEKICGVEFVSIDRGPGIANLSEAMRDGFSSGGGSSPGTGIGAVRRLSTAFDIYTQVPAGTVVLSRLWHCDTPGAPHGLDHGLVCLPVKTETACGDAVDIQHVAGGRTLVLLADGLGHGPQAAEASRKAVTVFRDHLNEDTTRIVQALHAGLRSTRGAAVAVLDLRAGQREVRFTGVGNIAATVIGDGKPKSMMSHNGTIGGEARRIQELVYPWLADSMIVAHSDGLSSHWNLGQFPGLRFRKASIIAATLYRSFRRERDDVTVLVIGSHSSAVSS